MFSIKNLFTIICICFTTIAVSQIDTDKGNNKSNTIKFKAKIKTTEKPEELNPLNTNGFESAYTKKQKELQKKIDQEEKENKEIITPELKRKIQFNKFMEKNTLQIPKIDMDLGSFETKSDKLLLHAFDFGRFDGDRINIIINGKIIHENVLLKSFVETSSIPLKLGFNVVEILAVNEGRLRPNTGAFKVVDTFGEKVLSDIWNLAKGAKVIAHVIRIESNK